MDHWPLVLRMQYQLLYDNILHVNVGICFCHTCLDHCFVIAAERLIPFIVVNLNLHDNSITVSCYNKFNGGLQDGSCHLYKLNDITATCS